MHFKYFIGIDVSKSTLDFCLISAGKVVLHLQTENNSKGVKNFVKQSGCKLEESLFCMEHTGIYNYPLLDYFSEKNTAIWLGKPRLNRLYALSTQSAYNVVRMTK
ncbi:IS110 family transposase [Catalinimonas alkaloidigena]|uniref:IS110 family transposase n=1 Tax=Catalinimonas alkaloidigena TaxID=1075417 RepID=UPI0024063FC0|nr:transposase [Catalinimonas alkaloidigena]